MIKSDIAKVERALVLLVKGGLNGGIKEESSNKSVARSKIIAQEDLNFEHMEWGKLITLAKKQGVVAIALDGFPKIYTEIIPKDIKIRWERATELVEERYKKQIDVLKELVTIFRENSINTIVINNLCISNAYPVSNHRECADLNIAQPQNWEKGNKVIDNLGVNVRILNSRHSFFSFRGVTVHNHKINPGKPAKILVDNLEAFIPELNFTASFLINQITDNFLNSSFVLRHLVDLSLFFESYSKEINFEQLTRELKREGKLKLILHLLILSHKLLGFETGLKQIFLEAKEIRYIRKKSNYSEFESDPLYEKIYKDIFSNEFEKSNINDLITMSSAQRKTIKVRELSQNRWKFRLIKRTLFCKTFIKTILH